MSARHSTADRAILALDRVLRTLGGAHHAARPSPAASRDGEALEPAQREHSAGLMRVNHSGEVCAQALYLGQALVARDAAVRGRLLQAAAEEEDHLAWCRERLHELQAGPSRLDPLWYAASFGVGAAAGLLGDAVSLGFVAATEDQVREHLDRHLESLPPDDQRSREVIRVMRDDEVRHGEQALAHGGRAFPAPVRRLMGVVAKVMTASSYRI